MSSAFKIRRIDVVVALVSLVITGGLLTMTIVSTRESSRRLACAANLQKLGVALTNYHGDWNSLPMASHWSVDDLDITKLDQESLTVHATHSNWVCDLLPYLNQQSLYDDFDLTRSIIDQKNARARAQSVFAMHCPADSFNRTDNLYGYQDNKGRAGSFARGNYAINGGTNLLARFPGAASRPAPDGYVYSFDKDSKKFQMYGSGIAGINKAFRFKDIETSLTALIALEEIRAGVHSVDPRGVWALGQIGGSITWGHGMTGDDGSPNNSSERADDILGCSKVHDAVGSRRLRALSMPCVDYWDKNQQATARSMHAGGVNVVTVDGRVEFISNQVDRGVWHVRHSRKSLQEFQLPPMENATLARPGKSSDTLKTAIDANYPHQMVNSIGMSLVRVNPGTYFMGTPDVGHEHNVPPETPRHRISISKPFFIGQYEVTQDEYQSIMGRNPSVHSSKESLAWITGANTGRFPVDNVCWFEAQEFCRRLTRQDTHGLRYRLPTEAEWEYVCREGTDLPFSWSRTPDPYMGYNAGEQMDAPLLVANVGSYPPNKLDVYDMRGNLFEWCSDWFARDFYSKSVDTDPQGPKEGTFKVVRGGDWIFVGEGCLINRRIAEPASKSQFIGFRVVAELPSEARISDHKTTPNSRSYELMFFGAARNFVKPELVMFSLENSSGRLVHYGQCIAPAWHPGGTAIAFVESDVLYVKELTQPDALSISNVRPFTDGKIHEITSPTWSSDGENIVFSAKKQNDHLQIFRVSMSTGKVDKFSPSQFVQTSPTWSPDGENLLFLEGQAEQLPQMRLVKVDRNGENKTIIDSNVPWDATPCWSPESKRIVIATWGNTAKDRQLKIINTQGQILESITEPTGFANCPAWSPDSRRIAWISRPKPASRGDLVVFDLEGHEKVVELKFVLPDGSAPRPCWNPKLNEKQASSNMKSNW